MGHKAILLTLMTASLVASQQPCETSFDCLVTKLTNQNSNGSSVGSENADNCECVPYYRCHNNTIATNGIGIIDIRQGGACENYIDICCKKPDVLTVANKVVPTPQARTGCGRRNPDGVGFRITGHTDEAQFGEFPWMVAIFFSDVANSSDGVRSEKYQCGGSLIHPRAVLTGAHCVHGIEASRLKIRAGEWDTQTKSELYAHQDREVETVVVHERFHSGALWNDVAILILKTPVDFDENVDVVCLPQPNENFDGSRCFASGWGKDKFGKEGQYQVILKELELPVVPFDSCQNSLRKTRLGSYFILDPSFVCAGGETGKDTCKGDGGGPLVCPLKNNPSRYAQVGIVAWGIGCGENQTPGVYSNVAYLREWIDENMVYNNLDIITYQP